MKVVQTITIHQLRVQAVTNASVLQIGTAGIVKSLSNSYNTGRFTGPAPGFGAPAEPLQGIALQPFAGRSEEE